VIHRGTVARAGRGVHWHWPGGQQTQVTHDGVHGLDERLVAVHNGAISMLCCWGRFALEVHAVIDDGTDGRGTHVTYR
jgi:hypothetical protein